MEFLPPLTTLYTIFDLAWHYEIPGEMPVNQISPNPYTLVLDALFRSPHRQTNKNIVATCALRGVKREYYTTPNSSGSENTHTKNTIIIIIISVCRLVGHNPTKCTIFWFVDF